MIASELRIGNLVKCKISNDAGTYTVSGIDGWKRVFKSKEDEEAYRKNNYSEYHDERLIRLSGGARENEVYIESKIGGIKLTEEWMPKFNFKYKKEVTYPQNEYWNDVQIAVDFKKNKMYLKRYKEEEGHAELDLPKYIHTFQNAVHSLTNTELTITL